MQNTCIVCGRSVKSPGYCSDKCRDIDRGLSRPVALASLLANLLVVKR